MNTRTLVIAAVIFFSLAPAALASTILFQQLPQDQCATYTWGFKTGTGCVLGEMCVMGSQNAGSEQVPTCMLIQAATSLNYTSSIDCNNACGHTCTSNPNSYITTYYCAPSTATVNGTIPAGGTCTSNPGGCVAGTTCTDIGDGSASYCKSNTAPAAGTQSTVTNTTPTQTQSTVTNTNTGTNVTLINPLKGGTSLESFLNNILDFVIRIGAIIVILMLVYVGFLFVTARGEPAEITKARTALLWTVVGALILLGAKAIALGITATVQALSVGQ